MSFQSYFYKNNFLHLTTSNGSLALKEIIGTYKGPTYIYNKASILNRAELYTQTNYKNLKVHYALKANTNSEILKLLSEKGLSADVVSWGEAELALKSGFKAKDIIFSGVGKTKSEIVNAFKNKIGLINVESIPELERIIKIAAELNETISVGLRINPNISVETHPYITTGFRENKFGISVDEFPRFIELLLSQKRVHLKCLGLHIGSQIQNLSPFKASLDKLIEYVLLFRRKGFEISDIDLGGGLGIDYLSESEIKETEDLKSWLEHISKKTSDLNLNFHLEPGRSIVARSGTLITEVQYIKKTVHKNFVIVDTGMHHLIRPPLYQAFHRILPLEVYPKSPDSLRADVVGPICESSDVIGFDRSFNDLQEGDLLAIMDTGAYGYVMSSNYNHHPKPFEILV